MISIVGVKTPLPTFNPAANPGVLPPVHLTGVKSPFPLVAISGFSPTANPLHFIPVKPLPGTASINQTVGYPT